MIADYKVICKEVSSENNIDLELLTSINNIVFKEVSFWSLNPDTLKVYIKYFGSWFFKKQKTANKIKIYQGMLKTDKELLDKTIEKINKKLKLYNFIIDEYEKYIRDKCEVKYKKYGKEAYEAYCLAKKQEKIQKSQKDKPL